MPKISIIVPVFGVEEYIERCARSLFEQTLDDIEFIFVDDCTNDDSIKVLKTTINQYPNRVQHTIIIHHEQNKGLPQARKSGLAEASGDYILHCDSDDWLELDACEQLYIKATETNSDIVVFDIEKTDGTNVIKTLKGAMTEDVSDFIIDMMYMRSSWSLVNKLYKKSVYEIVNEYPTAGISEDMALTLQLITNCKKMSYLEIPFYKYYINPNSMTQSLDKQKAIRNFYQCKENVDLILRFYSKISCSHSINMALNYVKWHTRFRIWPFTKEKYLYDIWRTTYKGVECSIILDKNVRFKDKIRIVLTYLRLYPYN